MKPSLYLPILASVIGLGPVFGETVFVADFTTAQGYADGNLSGQNDWQGQALAQVDTTGVGTVSSNGGPFDRNSHSLGARGGTGGVPNSAGNFNQFDTIKISFVYSFSLSGDGNINMGRAGIRPEGPNSGNGFNSAPTQGFYLNYNVFDPDPVSQDDGSVKFFPDLNDSANSEALIIEGLDVGISPGTGDGSGADLDSDPLLIEYVITRNNVDGWDVTSFAVTNQTTATTFTYSGPLQSFDWFETDPEVDSFNDAFFAQQLAFNSDNAFTGRAESVVFEYTMSEPVVCPVFDIDFTSAEGYVDGNLQFQQDWLGQTGPIVDSTGTGTVAGFTFQRNMQGNGFRGGAGGVPTTEGTFTPGESLRITVDYQFTLGESSNDTLGAIGVRFEGPNAGNNFESSPTQGFDVEYNGFDPDPLTQDDGNVKFYPDLTDTDNADALILEGLDVGISPGTEDSSAEDLVSDNLRLTWIVSIGSDDVWTVESFQVENLDTAATFSYSGPVQTFNWFETTAGVDSYLDAFYAQQYVRSSKGSSAVIDRVQVDFLKRPSIRPAFEIDFTAAEGYVDGNLQFQQSWLGQTGPIVDSTGSGTVTGFTFQRNLYGNGLRGGTGGVPTTEGTFTPGESVRFICDYQFTLAADGNESLGVIGIRPEGPNAGNNFEAAPTEGFGMVFSAFDSDPVTQDDGSFRIFPDLADTDLSEALLIEGIDVGVSPGTADGSSADLESDNLRITWTVNIGSDGVWTVESLQVENLDTEAVFTYSGPAQSFNWFETAVGVDSYLDAFYAQQYVRSSNGASATIDRVQVDFIEVDTIPAPPAPPLVINSITRSLSDVTLNYNTQFSEEGFEGADIYRSVDLINWTAVGFVTTVGDNLEITFTDAASEQFYILVQPGEIPNFGSFDDSGLNDITP